MPATIRVPKYDDIVPMIDILRPLRHNRIIDMTATITGTLGELVRAPRPDLPSLDIARLGQLSENEIDKLVKEYGIGRWHNRIALYGLPEEVKLKWEYIQDAYSAIPGTKFESQYFETPMKNLEDYDFNVHLQMCYPSFAEWGPVRGDGGGLFFAPVMPLEGAAVIKLVQALGPVYEKFGYPNRGIGQLHSRSTRSLTMVGAVPVSKTSDQVNKIALKMFPELIRAAAKVGCMEYRVGTYMMGPTMNLFSFNNHSLMRFHEKIKDAIDPNGVLAPGKYGIYPKHMREDRT